jgi:hypothetical protein
MRNLINKKWLWTVVALVGLFAIAPSVKADPFLPGTVLVAPGSTVIPGLVPGSPVGAPGTLLASLTSPYSFSTTAGTTSGTLTTAVFRNSSGTLDFYYQVSNSASSATEIARMTATSFTGFLTAAGYRTDGATLFGSLFVNGTLAPVTADRNLPPGSVVGFSFVPPISGAILPGLSSFVLVISTDATNFTAGNASVIDGGTQTVAAFQPTGNPVTTPEPATLLLLGTGLAGVAAKVRKRRKASKGEEA